MASTKYTMRWMTRRWSLRDGHVVVAGGAIAQPNGQVLINFIKEICHENRETCPEVVLLALRPPSDELKDFIKSSPQYLNRVKFICGSPLRKADLIRVRANKVGRCRLTL